MHAQCCGFVLKSIRHAVRVSTGTVRRPNRLGVTVQLLAQAKPNKGSSEGGHSLGWLDVAVQQPDLMAVVDHLEHLQRHHREAGLVELKVVLCA